MQKVEDKYKNIKFINHPDYLPDLRVSGCTGFVYNELGQICLVYEEEKGYWTLVGGGIDEGEMPLDCFIRETREEAQVDVSDVELLFSLESQVYEIGGHGEVNFDKKIKNDQQGRYLAKAENIKDFIPNFGGFEIDKREFVNYSELPNYLPWINTSENGIEAYNLLKEKLLEKGFEIK